MTSARRKKDGHRSIPKRHSSARAHGTFKGWSKFWQVHGRYKAAPSVRDWPEVEFRNPSLSLVE